MAVPCHVVAPMGGEYVSNGAARYTDAAPPHDVPGLSKIIFFNDLKNFSSKFADLARKVQ
jgi:hypothetical protein